MQTSIRCRHFLWWKEGTFPMSAWDLNQSARSKQNGKRTWHCQKPVSVTTWALAEDCHLSCWPWHFGWGACLDHRLQIEGPKAPPQDRNGRARNHWVSSVKSLSAKLSLVMVAMTLWLRSLPQRPQIEGPRTLPQAPRRRHLMEICPNGGHLAQIFTVDIF